MLFLSLILGSLIIIAIGCVPPSSSAGDDKETFEAEIIQYGAFGKWDPKPYVSFIHQRTIITVEATDIVLPQDTKEIVGLTAVIIEDTSQSDMEYRYELKSIK